MIVSHFRTLESNGDGEANQAEDYVSLKGRYLPDNVTSLAAPPSITKITQLTRLKKGISSQRIEVELIGADIFRVYATVIPPSFDPTAEISSWKDLAFDEFDLGKTGQGKYAATYANFTTPGAYSVVINAENAPGFADPVQTTITVAGGLEPAKLTGDVNNDGTVNIFDLVIAAGSFGKMGAGIMGDVNGDGSVNIFDLVIVAGNFGKSLVAAPATVASEIEPTTEQKHRIAIAIDQLAAQSERSSAEETHLTAGSYSQTETGEQVGSGAYFYQLQAGDYTETRKMVILK